MHTVIVSYDIHNLHIHTHTSMCTNLIMIMGTEKHSTMFMMRSDHDSVARPIKTHRSHTIQGTIHVLMFIRHMDQLVHYFISLFWHTYRH